ncbi:DHA2 family efflux MFS transporter permease subunit [Sorangium atrum]|uniref:DHA2 family efflux MFS transporter permease subunit n=1 Tax=Sorangium atrum TaxID=2995308 RepID=A0ABT5C4M5_9BACT|nr:DHA2 family efflux MFS transporter permease subunit [Sorangium aterium]MDC0681371.1 DHA2 family efflux MFS transporter permease subunit [Sorangium aterium]
MENAKNDQVVKGGLSRAMVVVLVCIFMSMLDSSIVNVALPSIGEALHGSFVVLQWIVLSYLVVTSGLVLAMGRLGDIFGKKRLYIAGIVIFTAGSAVCAVPWNAGWLLLGRAVQGVGSAILLALGPALVTELVAPAERGKAFGMMGATVSLGLILGPGLGGVLVSSLGWNWIFLINVPIGLFAAVRALRDIPSTRPAAHESFDLLGATALFLGISSLVIAITGGERSGMGPEGAAALWAVSVGSFIAFVVVELKVKTPLLDLRIFRNALFSTNLAGAVLNSIALGGTLVLMPFYLQNVLALSVRTTGLLLAVTPIALTVVAPLAGGLSDRFGARRLILGGLLITAVGFYAISTLSQETGKVEYALKFLVLAVGVGLFQTPNSATIMSSIQTARTGIGAGLLSVARLLGQTVGVATVTGLWSWRVMSHVDMASGEGPLRAPLQAQVDGFRDVFLILLVTTVLTGLIVAQGFRSGTSPVGPLAAGGGRPAAG